MPDATGGKAVFLVGFMGAGKTSVGRSLALRLQYDFEDLDDRVQAAAGRSIGDIFRDSGEAEFRRMEKAALSQLLRERNDRPRIVALGGGAFASPDNAELIATANATVVFLDGAPDELFRRCQLEPRERPLIEDAKRFHELFERRKASYLRASCRIDTTGKNIETVAAEVACKIGLE